MRLRARQDTRAYVLGPAGYRLAELSQGRWVVVATVQTEAEAEEWLRAQPQRAA